MIERELLEMYESQVRLRGAGEIRGDGHVVPGAWGKPVQAHVEEVTAFVVTATGEDSRSDGQVLLTDVYPQVTDEWQVELPDGQVRSLAKVQTVYGPEGPYQTVLYLGS